LRCTPKHEKIKLIVLLGKHLILYMSRVLKAPIENWCDASFDTLNYGVHKTRAPHGRPTSVCEKTKKGMVGYKKEERNL
jgi:hypothetical protein